MAQLLVADDLRIDHQVTTGCPACTEREVETFLRLDGMPVFNNVLYRDRTAAQTARTARIELAICHSCGLIFNDRFDESLVEYSPAYENSLHGSGVFGEWAEGLARRLAEEYPLAGGRVLEVGAGSGEFLHLLCQSAGCIGVGFDPSHDPDDDRAVDDSILVATGMGGGTEAADLVVCRHVLEHVADPVALLDSIAARSRPRIRGARVPVYVEVPDAWYMVTRDAFWDVIYEHPLYFDEATLHSTFAHAGFEVTRTGQTFGDQYAYIQGFTDGGAEPVPRHQEELDELITAVRGFGRRFTAAIDRQSEILADAQERGPVVIWGAGSKGVTYCCLVDHASSAQIIDVNGKKAGMRLPVTGQSVLPPQALTDMDVSLVVAMNGLYQDEIRQSLKDLGVAADVIVA